MDLLCYALSMTEEVIHFHPNGDISAYATPENQEFLEAFGKPETFGESQIVKTQLAENISMLFAFDEDGHSCSLCIKNKQYFFEVMNSQDLENIKTTIICRECYVVATKLIADYKQEGDCANWTLFG